jgi:RHS repeat-associated protein
MPRPDYAGAVPGEFAVSASGAANYSIPIELPPGTQGMMPSLAVAYSSSSGNEMMGIGWRLEGLSSITRTGATMAQDGFIGAVNYDPNDRFILDGQRLMTISGNYGEPTAIYGTELQSWKRIVPFYLDGEGGSGPIFFEVTTKDGKVLQYGFTKDARAPASSQRPDIRVWALNKITDSNGNYLEIRYFEDGDTNCLYPRDICYTGNVGFDPSRKVEFQYSSRPDPVQFYFGGYGVTTALRLDEIRTYLGSSAVLRYRFEYETSPTTGRTRLISATKFDALGRSLPAVSFSWQDADPDLFQPAQTLAPLDLSWGGIMLPMDINGDGLVDIVYASEGETGNLELTAFLSRPNGEGFGPGIVLQPPILQFGGQLLPMDVNGDGCIDLVYAVDNNGDLGLTVFTAVLADGQWSLQAGPINGAGPPGIQSGGSLFSMDVDGDGMADLVYTVDSGTLGLIILFSDGTSFAPSELDQTNPTVQWGGQCVPANMNGDGLGDLLYVTQNGVQLGITLFLSQGRKGLIQQPTNPLPDDLSLLYGGTVIPADLNGDGKVDLIYAYQQGANLALCSLSSNGVGFELQQNLVTDLQFGGTILPMEINGDGYIDLVVASAMTGVGIQLDVFLSNGRGFFARSGVTQPFSSTQWGGALLPLDLDGDGRTDLLYVSEGGSQQLLADRDGGRDLAATAGTGQSLVLQQSLIGGSKADMMSLVSNGVGSTIEITYRPITDPLVYVREAHSVAEQPDIRALINDQVSGATYTLADNSATQGATYATRAASFPMHVTTQYVKTDGTGNRYRYSYRYGEGRFDLRGRGWLGFAFVWSFDHPVGTCTLSEYGQQFPYTMTLQRSTLTRLDDNALMVRVDCDYAAVASAGETTQLELKSKRTDRYEFGAPGALPDSSTHESYAYDEYANATRVVLTSIPGSTVVVQRQFLNDPERWLFGFEVEKLTVGDDGVERRERATYEAATMNRTSSSAWDSQNEHWITTQYAYDAYGNIVMQTMPSGAITYTQYDSVCHTFIAARLSAPNAQGRVLKTQFEYYPEFGVEKSRTHPQFADDSSVPLIVSAQKIDGIGRPCESLGLDSENNLVTLVRTSRLFAEVFLYEEVKTRLDWNGTHWQTVRSECDGLLRVVRTLRTGPDGVRNTRVDRIFDSRDNAVSETLPHYEGDASYAIARTYDAFGRLTQEVRPGQSAAVQSVRTEFRFQQDNKVLRVDAAGSSSERNTTYQHSYFGGQQRLISRTDANGEQATFAYDALGRLKNARDPNGVTSLIEVDSLDRQTAIEITAGAKTFGRAQFAYDDAKHTVSSVSADGTVSVVEYDGLNRLISKQAGSLPPTKFVYDRPDRLEDIGMLTSVTTPEGIDYGFSYDANGRQNEILLTMDGAEYRATKRFLPTGELLSLTFPNGAIQLNQYNAGGSMVAVQYVDQQGNDPKTLATYDGYTAFGQAQHISYGNSLRMLRTFSDIGQLQSWSLKGGSEPLGSVLTWNELNLLVGMNSDEQDKPEQFGYDNAGRLQSATGNYPAQSFAYDGSGNMVGKNGTSYSFDGYQLVSGKQGSETVYTATYDEVGALSTATTPDYKLTCEFDVNRRLVSANGTQYAYDYTGRRVKKSLPDGTVIRYIAPYFEVTQLPDGQRSTQIYLFGADGLVATMPDATAATSSIRYCHRDQTNSTIAVTDASGVVTLKIQYLPFGEVFKITGGDEFRRKFSGKELDDETGLYYFDARYYDSRVCCFISPDDRLGGALEQRDVLNRYAYVLNDPLSIIDPTGHSGGEDFAAYLIDAVMIGGGLLLLASTALAGPAATTAGSALLGAGFSGLAYNISLNAAGDSFSFKEDFNDYMIQVGIGALTGAISGGASAVAAKIIGQAAKTGAAMWAVGGSARVATNLLWGTAGNAAASLAGEMAGNWAQGKSWKSGLGWATLYGAGFGFASAGAGEVLAKRVLSRATTAEEFMANQPLQNYNTFERVPSGVDAEKFIAGRPLLSEKTLEIVPRLPRVLDNTIRNNVIMTLPGMLFGGIDTALSDLGLHPSW